MVEIDETVENVAAFSSNSEDTLLSTPTSVSLSAGCTRPGTMYSYSRKDTDSAPMRSIAYVKR